MSSHRQRRSVVHAGFRAALLAGVAAELVVSVARALDVPMRAGSIGAATPVTLPPGLVGLEAAIGVLAGAIIAKALSRRSRHPRCSFLRLATTLTALSLVSPIAAGATTAATKVTLVAAHIVVAAIAIPLLSRALPGAQERPQHRGTSPLLTGPHHRVAADWYDTFFTELPNEFWRRAVTDEATTDDVDFIEGRLELRAGSRVLDVPCGSGRHTLALAARGHHVVGLDVSSEAIEHARRAWRRRSWQSRSSTPTCERYRATPISTADPQDHVTPQTTKEQSP